MILTAAILGGIAFWLFMKLAEANADNASLKVDIKYLKESLEIKPTKVPVSPEWLASDVQNLQKFFKSETGSKLLQRGRAMEYAMAVAGCNDVFHTTQSASKAGGFGECLNWHDSLASDAMFEKLSQATGEQVAKDTSDFSQDEEALLEKLSP